CANMKVRAPTAHLSRGGGLIAQSRWPRGAIWRSSGYDFGTELDAPAGPKRVPKVYVVSILKPVLRRHCNVCTGFLVTSLTDCHKLGSLRAPGGGAARALGLF